jgi:hypothetical protein
MSSTLSSRPKQIIANAMVCAGEGPCVNASHLENLPQRKLRRSDQT